MGQAWRWLIAGVRMRLGFLACKGCPHGVSPGGRNWVNCQFLGSIYWLGCRSAGEAGPEREWPRVAAAAALAKAYGLDEASVATDHWELLNQCHQPQMSLP